MGATVSSSAMTVYETDVPGVGKKFELETGDGEERLVVVVHHDGTREVYRRPSPDADSEKLFTVSGERARQLGSILEGAYFEPVELEAVRAPVGGAVIEWHDVPADSPVVGGTIADAGLARQTAASIVAVQRGEATTSNPEPDFTLAAGDVLVSLGAREEQRALADLLAASDDGDGESDA